MVIKNTAKLATTEIRRDTIAIAEAGYDSINMIDLFSRDVMLDDDILSVSGKLFNLKNYENIYVVGIGKASALAAAVIEALLTPERITAGIVVDITTHPLRKIKSFRGTHPLPSDQNIYATEQIIRMLRSAGKKDLVISIICGGGSSLLCKPATLTCLELQFITSMLLRAGANISQINTIRKHLSLVHGGHLARYAYPAEVLSLITSDVPGDNLEMIASGPTIRDTTTLSTAKNLAKKFSLPDIELMETPKDPKYFRHVSNILIASGSKVVTAMAGKAHELGYKPRIYSKSLSGLADVVGPQLAKAVRPGEALLACGETEVVVTHPGQGGRNQDVALSALPHLPVDTAIASCASDGKDNLPVAGAICDSDLSKSRAQKAGIDPTESVKLNRSYLALRKMGDLLHTNRVTANVSDFIIVLRK